MLVLILQNNIIKNKDASMLPFPMIASGAVVGFLWLIYGLLIDNIFIKVNFEFCFNWTSVHKYLYYLLIPGPKRRGCWTVFNTIRIDIQIS